MTDAADALPAHGIGPDPWPRILPVGDAAVSVEFGDAIAPEINAQVVALDIALAAAELPGIAETMPTFRSLLVRYEPAELGFGALVAALRALLRQAEAAPPQPGRRWEIPVAYGPPHGEDLPAVAAATGLTAEEVVARHAGTEFLTYAVGFAPGLPILGGLPPALHLPRRPAPRPVVAAGSVVIAGAQAGLISVPVPSGWHILGRTPVRAYDPRREDPFLFAAGDRIRFRPVGAAEFARLEAAAAAGAPVATLAQAPYPVPARRCARN